MYDTSPHKIDQLSDPMRPSSIHIILVEDSPGDTRLMREMLKDTDYADAHVHSFRNLRDAIDAPLASSMVSTILLDLGLPDSDGLCTLARMKERYPESAIIVLTGAEDEAFAPKALRAGAQNYLTKSEVNPSMLGRTVRNSIERHGFMMRLRDNDRLNAERDRRFRMLVEHSADLTLVVDRDGAVSYASPTVRRTFGYRKDQALNVLALIHPDDMAQARRHMEKVQARPGVPVTMVLRVQACDGRYLHLEGTAIDLFSVSGVNGIVVNFHDVTARITLEQRIALERGNLNALINSTRDHIWSVDRENRLVAGNGAFLDAVELFIGRRLVPGDSMIFPDLEGVPSAAKWMTYFQRAIGGEHVRSDEHITRPVEAWLEVHYSPIMEEGRIIGAAGFIRDITERVLLEKRIAFERNNLAALINSTHDMVWSVDRDLCLIAANEAFLQRMEKVTGVRPALGDSLKMLLANGDPSTDPWYQPYQRALTGESFTVEERMVRPAEVFNQVMYNPVMEDGEVVGVAVFSRDITEAHKTQQAMERMYQQVRTSELQKSAILDALPANIALLDQQGTIVEVNEGWRAFAEANGYKGKGYGVGADYLAIAQQATGADPGPEVQAAQGIIRTATGLAPGFTMEYTCDERDERRWFQMQVAPITGPDAGGTVVMHMDITARKLAEEKMVRNEATMAQAQAIAHFGTWELNLDKLDDPDSGPHAWSDEVYRIVGLDPVRKGVSLKMFFDLVHPDDLEKVELALKDTIRSGKPYSLDHRIVRPDGAVRWVHEEGALVIEDGRARRVLGTVHDISERRSIEERVFQLNSELEQRVADRTRELLLTNAELESVAYTKEKLANALQVKKEEQTASLRYARGIQEALLPTASAFVFFHDYAIMDQPLDLVGGDMYWAHATERFQYVAVGDCTGHGVPGAMLTMVGHDILNSLILEEEQVRPETMLARIDRRFEQLFHADRAVASMKDGMDMALCIIDRHSLELTFAGATLSAIVLREGALIDLPGARVHLGGLNLWGPKDFTTSSMRLKKGDRLILGTDGFADQFGGPHNRKLMRAQYHELVRACAHLKADDAVAFLRQRFEDWKGDYDQVDDVVLMVLDV
jgi:PAS domain S-box-containing protein